MKTVTDEQANAAFAKNMNRLMKEHGISQAELARQIGESEARISFYRSENRAPTIGVATRIADFFGVSVDQMLVKQPATKRKQKKVANSA